MLTTPLFDVLTLLLAYLSIAVAELLQMDNPQPVQPTDYDTCWVARLKSPDGTLAYPDLLQRLIDRQRAEGS